VAPSNGTAMNTQFSFVAGQWSDSDLPLSFQFGFTAQGMVGVLRGRAESAYTTAFLPAGKGSDGFGVVSVLTVFDGLNAYSTAKSTVIVLELVISSVDLGARVLDQLSTSQGDLDSVKQTLSVASSMLNRKECSGAPDCASLYRSDCDSTENTCGPCVDGFVGIDGDDNSVCVDESVLSESSSEVLECTEDASCGLWEFCDKSLATCQRRPKTCTNDCSGHGSCVYRDISFGSLVHVCGMSDISCEAICECLEGYTGSSCGVSGAEMEAKQNLRQELLQNLETLIATDEPAADSVAVWQSSLSAMTQSMDELTPSSSTLALSVASTILGHAEGLDLPTEGLLDMLRSIDAAANSGASGVSNRRLSEELAEMLAVLDDFGSYASGRMAEGQDPVEKVQKNFRFATQEVVMGNGNGSLAIPQTKTEKLSGQVPTKISVSGSGSQKMYAISLLNKLYGNGATSATANPVKLGFPDYANGEVKSVSISFQNTHEQRYPLYTSQAEVNTTCAAGDLSAYVHQCPFGEGESVEVVHQCTGSAEILHTVCPTAKTLPLCQLLGDSVFACNISSFTATETVCTCAMSPAEERKRALLGVVAASGALEVIAVSRVVSDNFVTTIMTAEDLNSVADLQKTIIVLVLYGVIWGGGLSGILLCSMRHRNVTKKVATGVIDRNKKKKMAAMAASDIRAVKKYITGYGTSAAHDDMEFVIL
jgi:hypothetical protein